MIPNNERESNPKGGRPRVHATPEQVRDLRDNQGLSWRRIEKFLGIGKTTAARLYSAAPGSGVSLNPETASQNPRSDVGDGQQGVEPAQPPGEQQHAGGAPGVGTPPAAANPAPANPPITFPRIKPSRNLGGSIWPVDGKPPGPCSVCGSRAWRLMPDGSCVCSVCRPLTG